MGSVARYHRWHVRTNRVAHKWGNFGKHGTVKFKSNFSEIYLASQCVRKRIVYTVMYNRTAIKTEN